MLLISIIIVCRLSSYVPNEYFYPFGAQFREIIWRIVFAKFFRLKIYDHGDGVHFGLLHQYTYMPDVLKNALFILTVHHFLLSIEKTIDFTKFKIIFKHFSCQGTANFSVTLTSLTIKAIEYTIRNSKTMPHCNNYW